MTTSLHLSQVYAIVQAADTYRRVDAAMRIAVRTPVTTPNKLLVASLPGDGCSGHSVSRPSIGSTGETSTNVIPESVNWKGTTCFAEKPFTNVPPTAVPTCGNKYQRTSDRV
jgi:hypothetical protein